MTAGSFFAPARGSRALAWAIAIMAIAGPGCRRSFPVCERNDQCPTGAACVNGACVAQERPDAAVDVVAHTDAEEDHGSPSEAGQDRAPTGDASRDVPADSHGVDAAPDDVVPADAGSPDVPRQSFPNLGACLPRYQHSEAPCDPAGDVNSWMITGLAYSRNGRLLASAADDGKVVLWSAEPDRLVRLQTFVESVGKAFVTFSPTADLMAVGAGDGKVVLWNVSDVTAKTFFSSIPGHNARIVQLAFAAGGTKLVSFDAANRLLVSTVSSTPPPLRTPRAMSGVSGALAVDPKGTTGSLWVAFGMTNGTVQLVDVLAEVWSSLYFTANESNSPVVGLAFSPDGKILATGSDNGEIALWDVSSKSMVVRYGPPPVPPGQGAVVYGRLESPWELAFTRDGLNVFAGSAGNDQDTGGLVRNYAVSSTQAAVLDELTPQGISPFRMALAPDDSSLVVGYQTCGRIQLCPNAQ